MVAGERVLVLHYKSLFAQGIERLLTKVKGLQVESLELERDDVLEKVRRFQPGAIIVDVEDIRAFGDGLVLQILREDPRIRVVCLSTTDSKVDIYDRHQTVVGNTEELVKAVQVG